jgi:hypothetical protein
MVGNKGEGDRPHGNQKDRTKLAEMTQADKAPIRYPQKAEDHQKSLSSPRQQAEPASKGTAQLRSHETAVNKGEGDRPHGNSNDRTKLAEKTQAGKVPIGNAQKTEDHKKSLSKLHHQAQPPTKFTAKPHSDEAVANDGEGNRAHGYRKDRAKLAEKTEADKAPSGNAQKAGDHKKSLVDEPSRSSLPGRVRQSRAASGSPATEIETRPTARDRAKPQAEKTQAEKASIGKDQKAEDHKKSASNVRQQAHPAGKGTANPRT